VKHLVATLLALTKTNTMSTSVFMALIGYLATFVAASAQAAGEPLFTDEVPMSQAEANLPPEVVDAA
jgi:hypothetical protein